LLKFLYSLIGNYGLAIIVLTVLVKLLLLPFTYKSEASMRQQAEVQKKLAYLQQRYKDDPEKLNQERTELIRKHGMPGLGGCLPLLLQLPLFIALSRVLYSSIELYKAPMWWIPDLSASDPYYILPIGVAIVMLLQAATVDAKQRLSVIAMALVFGALTVNFASGLALYIFVSTLLTVVQTSTLRYFNIVK
jgi:YidC/Oxa1 family membrane protein insertase